MFEPYFARSSNTKVTAATARVCTSDLESTGENSKSKQSYVPALACEFKIKNSDAAPKIIGMSPEQEEQLQEMLNKYAMVISDIPGKTTMIVHDIQLTSEIPINLHPYRMLPAKLQYLKKEVDEILTLGLVGRSHNPYSFPVAMIPKPDRTQRVVLITGS